jgi:signal transduction histidine kinase
MPTSTAWSNTASEVAPLRSRHGEDAAIRAALVEIAAAMPPEHAGRDALKSAAAEGRIAAAAAGPADAGRVALGTVLADVLGMCAAGRGIPTAPGLAKRVAAHVGADPVAFGLEVAARVFGDPRVTTLPPPMALDAVVGVLTVVAPIAHVSLWRRAGHRLPRCTVSAGLGGPSRSAREAAQQAFGGPRNGSRRGLLQVAHLPDREDALLVARPRRGSGTESLPFLRAAARTLGPLVDRAGEVEREMSSAQVLADSSERRVARIGFDLHDGPIQTLAALIGDARLMGSQVGEVLRGDARQRLVAGRVADLQAQMVALEFELRCMCHSLESPAVLCRPIERVIEHEVVAFQRRTGIRPEVQLQGDFGALTPSQRIAVLRIVQEALRNVCEHSDARSVRVSIIARADATEAFVEDDGSGFDVDAALGRAVRDGRVGLIGMMERVRLLGGRCEVRSRVGGPSTVAVLLPAWRASPQAVNA